LTAEQIERFAAEFDPQPFHLSHEGAAETLFGSLAASGWHTAALTMRMLVQSVPLANGLVGAELQLAWPKPTRPGMTLQVFSEVVEIKPSRSKPDMAMVTMRNETRDQDGEVVQVFTVKMPVFKRP
jgi:acyl dehydratase